MTGKKWRANRKRCGFGRLSPGGIRKKEQYGERDSGQTVDGRFIHERFLVAMAVEDRPGSNVD